jgi:hypothetical protein
MTYVYPLLPGYDNARYILNHLMKKYRSTIEVIFLPLHNEEKIEGKYALFSVALLQHLVLVFLPHLLMLHYYQALE